MKEAVGYDGGLMKHAIVSYPSIERFQEHLSLGSPSSRAREEYVRRALWQGVRRGRAEELYEDEEPTRGTLRPTEMFLQRLRTSRFTGIDRSPS